MGASNRKKLVAAGVCLGLLTSQSALADGLSKGAGWLERFSSITSGVIPDIKLSAYLDRDKDGRGLDTDTEVADKAQRQPYDLYLPRFGNQPENDSYKSGWHYGLVDSDVEDIGSSAGSYLLSADPNAHSKVSGLARSAVAESRLPTYGIDVAYSISPRWSLGMRGHFLDIATSELVGDQSAYSASFKYAPREAISVGFGYEQFEMQADTQLQNNASYVAYRYSGPRIFTTLRF